METAGKRFVKQSKSCIVIISQQLNNFTKITLQIYLSISFSKQPFHHDIEQLR